MRERDDDEAIDENNLAVLAMLRERRAVTVSDKTDVLASMFALEEAERARPRTLTPMFITRKFEEPPEHFGSNLMKQCESADECAKQIAYFILSMERIGSKHVQPRDETAASNAEPRVDELVRQLKLFTEHGAKLVHNAYKAEAIKCGHSAKIMRMIRHDKRKDGRCSECRQRLAPEGLHSCVLCEQSLCDACLPNGCHQQG